jgi:aminoglycoside 6'-N-acetyltransferase I
VFAALGDHIMNIVEITSDNLEACAELFTQVFAQPPWNESWTIAHAKERLEFYYNSPNFIGLAACSGGDIVGFIFGNYEPYQDQRVYLLKEMSIHPNLQGKGLGSELIQNLHELLRKRNISAVDLITEIDGEAANFYIKNGYAKSTKMGLYVSKFNT